MANMDRRNFLAAALGGAGGLGLAACVDTPGLVAPDEAHEDIDASGVYLRRNIYCLTNTSYDVVAYNLGRNAMMALPATDPTSWLAQANIHGTSAPVAGMLANQCQHRNYFFLSWHRMYLYYFERIVRSKSGRPNFALPYWGYSPTGQRSLPVMFRNGGMFHIPQRRAIINAGGNLAPATVDAGAAMAIIPFSPFSRSLEGTPHDVVHVGVGGGGGYMSDVLLAARDPIFWLHHANIDRLWVRWKALAGRFNPSDAAWLNTNFSFYDEAGSTVTMRGAQILDTVAQLRYRYVSCFPAPLPEDVTNVCPLDPCALQTYDRIGTRPPRPTRYPLGYAPGPQLGYKPVDVYLPIPYEAQQYLRGYADDPYGGNDIRLDLYDIAQYQEPQVYYEVYANLPDPYGARYESPHYVGNIDFYALMKPDPTGEMDHSTMNMSALNSRSLSLLRTYSLLRCQGLWRDDYIRLTFVPRAHAEGETVEQLLTSDQGVVGRIEVALE